jgi:hypothetical protein
MKITVGVFCTDVGSLWVAGAYNESWLESEGMPPEAYTNFVDELRTDPDWVGFVEIEVEIPDEDILPHFGKPRFSGVALLGKASQVSQPVKAVDK